MTKRETWRAKYQWRQWFISKDDGWYSCYSDVGPISCPAPIRFKRLKDAKKYCETLETLADWDELCRNARWEEVEKLMEDAELHKQAATEMSLDRSGADIAKELRDFIGDWETGGT